MATQAVQLERKLFTVDDYERMIAAGILTEDDRVELIRGEIVKMAAIGVAHAVCVSDISMLLTETVRRTARVWSQSPIRLQDSEPEPDVVLSRLRPDRYKSGLPMPADIYLLIEVADSSLASDRSVKIPLYAEAGIPEVWLVNLNENVVEVYTQPSGGQYGSVRTVGKGETLALPGGLEGTIAVYEFLG